MSSINPSNNNQNLWANWSYNDSTDDENSPQPKRVYPPGNPPPQKPDNEIKDWPPVPFGD